SHSSNVTENLPTANGAAIATDTCASPSDRSGSVTGDPIVNVPVGMTTISAQVGQSLNISFGFRQRISLSTRASMPSHRGVDGAGGARAGECWWGFGKVFLPVWALVSLVDGHARRQSWQ